MVPQRPRPPPTRITEDDVDISALSCREKVNFVARDGSMTGLDDLLAQLDSAVHRREVYLVRSDMKPVPREEANLDSRRGHF